ncbi:hypothetical protein [Treponema maltophilum]|uniref:hypothetical protein n=1 Tax=Treponema maltophilum TaxID=51160 RepID=UPI00039D89DF|nr:hypothetical protein [Treponema maltophilum]
MINEQNLQRIRSAQAILDELFPLVDEAERQFKSARDWGFMIRLQYVDGNVCDFCRYSF